MFSMYPYPFSPKGFFPSSYGAPIMSDFSYQKKARKFKLSEFDRLIEDIRIGSVTVCVLSLPNYSIDDMKAVRIFEALQTNLNITEVILSDNLISDAGVQTFGEFIQDNNALCKIDLSHNNISDFGALFLYEKIKHNLKIIGFNLVQNKISNSIISRFDHLVFRNIEIQKQLEKKESYALIETELIDINSSFPTDVIRNIILEYYNESEVPDARDYIRKCLYPLPGGRNTQSDFRPKSLQQDFSKNKLPSLKDPALYDTGESEHKENLLFSSQTNTQQLTKFPKDLLPENLACSDQKKFLGEDLQRFSKSPLSCCLL